MFPEKHWSRSGLNYLIQKIDDIGNINRRPGSGRQRSARTADAVAQVEELVQSQEDAPQTHSSQRQIARQLGVSVASACEPKSRCAAL